MHSSQLLQNARFPICSTGSVTIVCAATGALSGGYIVKKRQMKVQSIVKLLVVICIITLVGFTSMFIRCKPVDFAGVSVDYQGKPFQE